MKAARKVLLGLPMLLTFHSAFAQTSPAEASTTRSKLWGVGNLTAYTVESSEFTPYDPSVTWAPVLGKPFRYLTGAGPAGYTQLIAGIHLPQGASVVMIEVSGCDMSDTGTFTGNLWSAPLNGGAPSFVIETGSGVSDTGCFSIESFLANPVTIDNEFNVYYSTIRNSTFDGSTYVTGVKLFYQLQVSPAPGAATFADVPTNDPAFQFIEALAASGVTGGCGGGNYCPDASVTRRQMAVFLAKALGLYWQY